MTVVTGDNNKLGTEKVGKLLLTYSIPSIVSMVVVSLYNIVDRIFIGNGVGPMAISGLALTFPLMTLVAAIGTLVGVGAATRISIVLGMKDIEWAKNILGNAIVLTFTFSAILIGLSVIFMDNILELFGGSEQISGYAKQYLMIVIPGSIFQNLSFSYSNIMKASGYPIKAMVVILIGMVINLILDPIFIFVFDMGIQGAAIATVISMFISALFAMAHFISKKSYLRFHFKCMRLKKYIVRNIVSIGMSPFLMNVTASGVNIIMNNFLVRSGGDYAIGAYGIINSYAVFVIMIVMGLCQGMQPIVGYNFGAKMNKRVKDTLLLAIRIGVIIMIIGFILCEMFTSLLVGAFTSDVELADIARTGLRICFLMFPIVGFQIVVTNFFQSIGKVKISIFMSLTRQLLFLIPALFICSNLWGLIGVWIALPISDFLAGIVALFFLIRAKRQTYNKNWIKYDNSYVPCSECR